MRSREPKVILNVTRGNVVCAQANIAADPVSRLRGLLGRRSLSRSEGLLIKPAPSIHTFFMRFPIDAVFLDAEFRVVKLVTHLKPWRAASARRAASVLELAAGEGARRGIQVEHRLAIVEAADLSDQPSATGALLVSTDRRYRSVVSMLLARRGFRVMVARRDEDIADAARREGADVVVIDASASIAHAAREAGKLKALCPSVGVVIVSDQPEPGRWALPVVLKWGAFDSLFRAIETARDGIAWPRVTNGAA